jgi:phosphatidate cytidylyltransferase
MVNNFMQNNVLVRFIVALIILPIVGLALYLGDAYFMGFLLVLGFGGAKEWLRLTDPAVPTHLAIQFYLTLFSMLIFILTGLVAWGVLFFLAMLILYYARVKLLQRPNPIMMSFGFVYLFVPIASGLWLRNFAPEGFLHFLLLVLILVATDTGAFFTGRAIGGPKLAPAISPNKTWSGSIGGLLSAVLVSYLFEAYVPSYSMPISFWLVALLVSIMGQIGDLFESHMKRRAGVKDSGTLLPGHGGILDRVDSYLFGIPMMALLVYISI